MCAGQDATTSVGAVAPIDVSSVNGYAVEADIQLLRYNPADGSFGLGVRVQQNGDGYGFGATTDGAIVLATHHSGVSPTTLDGKPFKVEATGTGSESRSAITIFAPSLMDQQKAPEIRRMEDRQTRRWYELWRVLRLD